MRNKLKSSIDFNDFVFRVFYQRVGFYGDHEKRRLIKRSRSDLRVGHAKGGRAALVEWCPISKSEDCTASVKFVASLTWDGIINLIHNAELGIIDGSAEILDGDDFLEVTTTRSDIHSCGGYVRCYIAAIIPQSRLNEAINTAFKKDYGKFNEQEILQVKRCIDKYNSLRKLLDGYVEKLVNGNIVDVNPSAFSFDFRQLDFDF